MGKVKKAFGAFLVPLLSVLLAFLIGGIIMAALGANPFLAVKFLFQGAFGSKAGIGTTLTKATPLSSRPSAPASRISAACSTSAARGSS